MHCSLINKMIRFIITGNILSIFLKKWIFIFLKNKTRTEICDVNFSCIVNYVHRYNI